jgi:hypothetical protein
MGPLSLSACLHQLFVEFTLTNFDDRSQVSEGADSNSGLPLLKFNRFPS